MKPKSMFLILSLVINKVRVLDEPRMSPYPYLSFIYINQPYLFNAVARGMKEKKGWGEGARCLQWHAGYVGRFWVWMSKV